MWSILQKCYDSKYLAMSSLFPPSLPPPSTCLSPSFPPLSISPPSLPPPSTCPSPSLPPLSIPHPLDELPQWPKVVVAVASLDRWDRHRMEGYGYLTLPARPGRGHSTAALSHTGHLHNTTLIGMPELSYWTYCTLGDCLTSRPKGRSRPRELWFLIYSCTCVYIHVQYTL